MANRRAEMLVQASLTEVVVAHQVWPLQLKLDFSSGRRRLLVDYKTPKRKVKDAMRIRFTADTFGLRGVNNMVHSLTPWGRKITLRWQIQPAPLLARPQAPHGYNWEAACMRQRYCKQCTNIVEPAKIPLAHSAAIWKAIERHSLAFSSEYG